MSADKNTLGQPPRLTGRAEDDVRILEEYARDIYNALVRSGAIFTRVPAVEKGLEGKAALDHTHTIPQVVGLPEALAALGVRPPVGVAFDFGPLPLPASVTLAFSVPFPLRIPAGFVGSTGGVAAADTAPQVFGVRRNGVQIGTATVATSGAVTWALAAAVDLVSGDRLEMRAPASVGALVHATFTINAARL